MEMARFNRDWQKSGMRRLRLDNSETETQRQGDEDSQEKDFEPGSQASNNVAGGSQLNEPGDLMDGLMSQGPSSSPMQTSPLDNKGAPSSQQASQTETEHTSLDDDELPSIEQLAKVGKYKAKRIRSPSKALKSKRRRIANPVDSSPVRLPTSRVAVRQDSPDPLGFEDAPGQSSVADSRRSPVHSPAREARNPTQQGSRLDGFVSFPSDDISPSRDTEPPVHVISDDESTDSSASSDSAAEAVNKNMGRIRGVLPASYLRIDQHATREIGRAHV